MAFGNWIIFAWFHFRGCGGKIQALSNTVSSPSKTAGLTEVSINIPLILECEARAAPCKGVLRLKGEKKRLFLLLSNKLMDNRAIDDG